MNINEEANKVDRFVVDQSVPDIDTKKAIKILQEIKGLKE